MGWHVARWGLGCLILGTLSTASSGEPMRLDDPTPRSVFIQFENSPRDRPDLLDGRYTEPFAAWLEPDDQGRVTVRLRGAVLEESLFRENDPVAGSFSDFLWVFDEQSGDVLSAEFSGVFSYEIDWGFWSSRVKARVQARMATTRPGGFRPAKRILDRLLIGYCEDVDRGGCQAVEPQAYDASRGYVNAVGYLAIDSSFKSFDTFSALGEARFSEVPAAVPTPETGSEVAFRAIPQP